LIGSEAKVTALTECAGIKITPAVSEAGVVALTEGAGTKVALVGSKARVAVLTEGAGAKVAGSGVETRSRRVGLYNVWVYNSNPYNAAGRITDSVAEARVGVSAQALGYKITGSGAEL
jgi:hypothetical protein